MKPSNFTKEPWGCIFQKKEYEIIAQNIMVIQKRLGDEWGGVDWETYKSEREKDGGFSEWSEKPIFEKVLKYTTSPENASKFSPDWNKIYNSLNK